MTQFRLGLISALHQEQAGLIEHMHAISHIGRGMRNYASGRLWDTECVCVLSRIGKVAAAATAVTLIERFGVTHIVFTGVAGSADPQVRVGDLVVAEHLVQHDIDASPLFPRFEVPLTGQSHFLSDKALTGRLTRAASDFIAHDFTETVPHADREVFRISHPRLHNGLIASGDEFINSQTRLADVKGALPQLLAVEMEGAAVAQVCFEFGIPFAVIRTISDAANEDAPVDFMQFIERVAARYAFGVVKRLCTSSGAC
jgi:adenosylhomocysteine nucleosidase